MSVMTLRTGASFLTACLAIGCAGVVWLAQPSAAGGIGERPDPTIQTQYVILIVSEPTEGAIKAPRSRIAELIGGVVSEVQAEVLQAHVGDREIIYLSAPSLAIGVGDSDRLALPLAESSVAPLSRLARAEVGGVSVEVTPEAERGAGSVRIGVRTRVLLDGVAGRAGEKHGGPFCLSDSMVWARDSIRSVVTEPVGDDAEIVVMSVSRIVPAHILPDPSVFKPE
jgi:hypothetical protein